MRKIIEKFDQYTIHELIETFERPQFDSRNQEENETLQTRRQIKAEAQVTARLNEQ